MPVHNAEDTLLAALDSILEQTDPDFECILVDDGSTDQTPEILARVAARDPRLRMLCHDSNRGIVTALNTGLASARGEFVLRMDADDVAHPDRLRRQREYLQNHAEVGLVGCRVEYGGDRATQAGYAAYVDWTNTLLDEESIRLNRFIESPFAHPSVMFRMDMVKKLGEYREGPFPEDYELWLRWLDAGVHMAKLPETLLRWNDPPERLSRAHPRYSPKAFGLCKAMYLARWLARHNPHHPEVLVWGAGRETRKRAELLVSEGVRIGAYIDIDPRKIGNIVHGRPVIDETELPPADAVFVVSYVGSRGARDDIRRRLDGREFTEGRNYVMCA